MAKLLFQRSKFLNNFEKVNREETDLKTLCVLNYDHGTMFLSWEKKRPLIVHVASDYDWNPMKLDLFHTPTCDKSRSDLLRELLCPHQDRDTNNSPSFFEFLHTAPSENETTTATKE